MLSLCVLCVLLQLCVCVSRSAGRPCPGCGPARVLLEPCGVYLRPCGPGLRCMPPPGAPSPLQELLRGRGACRAITSTGAPPLTDYEPSVSENSEKGPCRRLLSAVLQSLELTVIHADHDIYIPNCDPHGAFRRKQCRSSRGSLRGQCWCVDEDGSRVSSRRRSDGSISCS